MKRHKALSHLSSDHHHGLRFAKKLRLAINGPDSAVKNTLREFEAFYKSMLLGHFEEEEKFLAPLLNSDPFIIKMCNDHKKMNELFAALSKSTNLKENLYTFGSFLEEHIRFEEKELFPFIESALPEEELEEIGKMIDAQRGSK